MHNEPLFIQYYNMLAIALVCELMVTEHENAVAAGRFFPGSYGLVLYYTYGLTFNAATPVLQHTVPQAIKFSKY